MSGLEGLLAGRTLVKRYRIEQVIGRGGFAAVYRADDERLGRPVAVKVITLAAPDEAAREHLRERFQREARAAASLPQHPNVVTVHDFGTDPELGLDFLVMEFLHGEDLATHLARQRKLPLESALRILRDAVEGVAVGHRAGLVHRDVKPGNIFLAEPHGEDPFRVCVVDFGIARVATKDQTVTRLTQTGVPLSPAYASPEQLRGDRNLTATSDVFSLGVVAYQLLTGEKPLRADRTAEPQDWVPDRKLRELNPAIPVAVQEVVERAMSFEAADRYPDADAMADALDRAMDEAPVGGVAAAPVPIPVPVELPAAEPVTLAPEPGAAAPVPESARPAPTPVPTPVPVAPLREDEDEHTLLQAEAPLPPPPVAPRAAIPVVGAAPKRSFATWGIVLLVAGLVTVVGLWALTRGSPGRDGGRTGADIILESGGPSEGTPQPSSGPRVTGEIVETPGEPLPGDPAASFPGSTIDPSAPLPGGASGGGALPQAPGARPGVTLPPQRGAAQPQPQEPQPQQPAPAPAGGGQQPAPAGEQPAQPQPQEPAGGPPLLGRPVDQPGAGAGGGTAPQPAPRPDTTAGGG